MWVTDPHSPASSTPSTPSHSAVHIPLASPNNHPSIANQGASGTGQTAGNNVTIPPLSPTPFGLGSSNNRTAPPSAPPPPSAQPHHPSLPVATTHSGANTFPQGFSTAVPASSLPGARLSGRLVGVVSLTDILNTYARASGLSPADPNAFRTQRRRSSSSSFRRSGDIARELRGRA